ncbi:MAG: hypothetical protein PHT12_00795 [Patescibacteria group bacterium]|nr:hypothetical protein [Patescibacteria group bacterium]
MSQANPDFEQLRSDTEELYKGLGPMLCPALKEDVYFTSEGFNHLRYKFRVPRTEAAQRRKFKVFPKAPEIIKVTTTIQEYRVGITRTGKPGRDGLCRTAQAQYWGFVHVFSNNVRVRAIVRKVGNGQAHFWSVMPSWKEVESANGPMVRCVGGGDMEDE